MTTSLLNNNNTNINNNSSSSNNKNNSTNNNNNKTNTTTTTNNNNNNSDSDITEAEAAAAAATAATAAITTTTTSSSSGSSTANRSMQSDEDFNIRFVNLVRAHKCLYDKKVPEYRNRDNQEKAWTLISQETCESVIHCKERWRNLRACLSRYIKQQSGADPQHKPYYLTEHMSFLLPFLKSTRNSLEAAAAIAATNSKAGLAVLLHLTQQQQQQQQQQEQQPTSSATSLHTLSSLHHMQLQQQQQQQQQQHAGFQDMKHSLSENEETIDAFDPVITASLQHLQQHPSCSPPLSDTASANSIQHFIPDVQLAELRTPEPPATVSDMFAVAAQASSGHHHHHLMVNGGDTHHNHEYNNVNNGAIATSSAAKRIKTECPATVNDTSATSATPLHCYSSEHVADMDFFRSIMPDIAALTPQQKRKLKIGILELIDDVVDRFPGGVHGSGERGNGSISATNTTFMGNGSSVGGGGGGGGGGGCASAGASVSASASGGNSSAGSNNNCRQTQQHQCRNSSRDWRK